MPKTRAQETLLPEQRRDALAQLLAAGLQRLHARHALEEAPQPPCSMRIVGIRACALRFVPAGPFMDTPVNTPHQESTPWTPTSSSAQRS